VFKQLTIVAINFCPHDNLLDALFLQGGEDAQAGGLAHIVGVGLEGQAPYLAAHARRRSFVASRALPLPGQDQLRLPGRLQPFHGAQDGFAGLRYAVQLDDHVRIGTADYDDAIHGFKQLKF